MWRIFGPAIAALVFPGLLAAQTGPANEVGPRVRLTLLESGGADSIVAAPQPRVMIGRLVSVDGDSVILVQGRDQLSTSVAMESIQRLEVSRGRRSRAGRGALVGFLAGAVTGAVTGYWICRGCEPDGLAGFVALVVGGMGALAGTGVGAIVGAIARTERWEPRPLTDLPVGVRLSPTVGFRLAGSIPLRISLPH